MYTIKEASARSGVGIPLLRAWERRYGVVAPTRTPSGYRLYDDGAILRLAAMRNLIDQGWAAQQAAQRVAAASDEELVDLGTVAPVPASEASVTEPEDASGSEMLIERIVGAARRLDGPELEAALDATFSAVRFETAADRVLMPALRAIGEAWERAEVSVAGEHAASQAVLRRLAMAYEAAGDTPMDRPILVGLAPGARHEFGAFAFATAARRAGLPVLYLGPDLPAESWVGAATAKDARAAVIGVPRRADVERTAEVVSALRAASPRMVLAVGGPHGERVAGTGVLALPSSLTEAVGRLRSAVDSSIA